MNEKVVIDRAEAEHVLQSLEECALMIDGEWGQCRTLDEMQETGAYPSLVREPIAIIKAILKQEDKV
jgi:hypothetical protein